MSRLLEWFVVIAVFAILWVVSEYFFLRMDHPEKYIVVQSVEPQRQVFSLWEEPKFISNIQYKKPWYITREDVQFCSEPWKNDYWYYSQYITSFYREEPKNAVNKPRTYKIPWPKTPMDCYLYSTTYITLHYWVQKHDSYISWPYYYR